LFEAFDRGGDWHVHCIRGNAQREAGGGESRDVRRHRKFLRSGSAGRLPRPGAHARVDGQKSNGAILLGILGTTLYGIFRGMAHWPASLVAIPHPSSTLLQLDLRGAAHLGLLEITFAFLFVDLFDNVGTLVGVCEQAGFVKDGKIPGVGRALLADAVGTVFGSLTGTSTVTSYMRAPQSIAKVKWEEYTDAFPAFVTMAATPLTFSIATGLSLGLISFTIVKIAAGKFREVSLLLWILTVLFILRYIYLAAA